MNLIIKKIYRSTTFYIYLVFSLVNLSVLTPLSYSQDEPQAERQNAYITNEGIDFDAPPQTDIKISDYISFGAIVELEFESERNFDFDDSVADDLTIFEPVVSLATTIASPDDLLKFYVNLKYSKEIELENDGHDKDYPNKLRFSQLYFSFEDLIEDTLIKIGRQRIEDNREWLYDDNLDSLRIKYQPDPYFLDFVVSFEGLLDENLLNEDSIDRVNDYFLMAGINPTDKTTLMLYSIYRDDRTVEWERPLFFGAHSSGEITDQFQYWADLSWVEGKQRDDVGDADERTVRFNGLGLDVGGVFEFDQEYKPSLIFGYAYGGGDYDEENRDHKGFRQTGLHDNSDRLSGVASINYYGELFDPELSNIHIFTVGAGMRPTKKTSLEFIYHYYRQDVLADRIKKSAIDADPDGSNKELGSEIDIVFGVKRFKNIEIKNSIGAFFPGDAFPVETDDTALFYKLKIKFRF